MSERKQFEEWFEADAMPGEADWFRLDEEGEYDHDFVHSAWRGWGAAAAALRVENGRLRQTLDLVREELICAQNEMDLIAVIDAALSCETRAEERETLP